jgi:hypothetical protein
MQEIFHDKSIDNEIGANEVVHQIDHVVKT